MLYPLEYADAVIALCESSLLATKLLLLPSKFAFGRTWPLYGHPSYLTDGSYGFNFSQLAPHPTPSHPGTQRRSALWRLFCG